MCSWSPPAVVRVLGLSLLASLSASLVGCGTGVGSSPASSSGGPAYRSMTEGPVFQRMAHIDALNRQFHSTDAGDPEAARKALVESNNAILATAKSVLNEPNLEEIDRNRAGKAVFDAYLRRMSLDPSKYQDFVASCENMIAQFPNSELASQAAFIRLNVLATVKAPELEDSKVRQDRMYDAAMTLAQQEFKHQNTRDVLTGLARELERQGDFTRATNIYRILEEKFADPEKAPFGQGHIYRLSHIGKPLDDLAGVGFEDQEVKLSDFRGKVVLVDFWASWCQPCLASMGELKALHEKLGPRGFEILGINCDDNLLSPEKIIHDNKLTWPQIVARPEGDLAPTPEASLEIRLGVEALPLYLIVDREGNLVRSGNVLGDLVESLEKLLPEPEAAHAPDPAPAPSEPAPATTEPSPAAVDSDR